MLPLATLGVRVLFGCLHWQGVGLVTASASAVFAVSGDGHPKIRLEYCLIPIDFFLL